MTRQWRSEEVIKFETILLAIDGSDHAKKAVLLASDIAAKYQARRVLLHVMPKGPLPDRVTRGRNRPMETDDFVGHQKPREDLVGGEGFEPPTSTV